MLVKRAASGSMQGLCADPKSDIVRKFVTPQSGFGVVAESSRRIFHELPESSQRGFRRFHGRFQVAPGLGFRIPVIHYRAWLLAAPLPATRRARHETGNLASVTQEASRQRFCELVERICEFEPETGRRGPKLFAFE